jgi:hypothetical protein
VSAFLGNTIDRMGWEVRPNSLQTPVVGLVANGCALSLMAQALNQVFARGNRYLCWACDLGSKMAIAACNLK